LKISGWPLLPPVGWPTMRPRFITSKASVKSSAAE
jgi:hypothetical protein